MVQPVGPDGKVYDHEEYQRNQLRSYVRNRIERLSILEKQHGVVVYDVRAARSGCVDCGTRTDQTFYRSEDNQASNDVVWCIDCKDRKTPRTENNVRGGLKKI